MGLAVLAVIVGLGLLAAFALLVLPRWLPPPPEVELPDPHGPSPDDENAWGPLAALFERLLASRDPDVQRMLDPPREQPEFWRVRDGLAVLVPEVPLPEPPPHPEPGPSTVRPWRSRLDPWLDEFADALARPRLVVPTTTCQTGQDEGLLDVAGSLVLQLLQRAEAARRDGALAQALDDWVLVLRFAALSAPAGSAFSFGHYATAALRAMTDALAPLPEGFDPLHDDPRVYWPRQWSDGQRELWRSAVGRLRPWLEHDAWLADVVTARSCEALSEVSDDPDDELPPLGLLAERLTAGWVRYSLDRRRWAVRTQALAALAEVRRPPWQWRFDQVKTRVPAISMPDWWLAKTGPGHYAPGRTRRWAYGVVAEIAREATDVLATLTNVRLWLLVIVLKVYQETHRRLPSTWEEVVDDGLLPRVPLDPYDGQPVRYDAPQGVVWCIGERWQDVFEGGYDGREILRLAAEAFPDPRQRAVARLPIEVVLPYITAARPAQGWWVSTTRSR